MNSAVISEDGRYRYLLLREAASYSESAKGKTLVFVMLNPSTADASKDDPTIRRCMGFASREGMCRLVVVNLYAFRATDPKELGKQMDPIGPENIKYISVAARSATKTVVAWGANAKGSPALINTVAVLQGVPAPLYCLGTTKDGSPRHPLYVRSDQPFIQWRPQ